MRMKQSIITALSAAFAVLCANCVPLFTASDSIFLVPLAVLLFWTYNILPIFSYSGPKSKVLRLCLHGVTCLRAFCISLAVTVPVQIYMFFVYLPDNVPCLLISILVSVFAQGTLFWNGMTVVYVFSVQLGLGHRLRGLLLGFVPIANLVMLRRIIRTVSAEVDFEREKLTVNAVRAGEKVCAVRYPLLLVHGVFFRDLAFPNYWGRIPHELEKNGAKIFYGNHGSAASVRDSAAELAARIRYITDDLGHGKVNIIAHSKGGLDCRYAVSQCGVADRVASLVTVNTPHKGCAYADYLLNKISLSAQEKIASAYNSVLKRLGDDSPDFLSAVRDLTESGTEKLQPYIGDENNYSGIYCISIGSRINGRHDSKLPLSLTHGFVKKWDGENDGLVSTHSLEWGRDYRFIENHSRRGISHADVIDMTRENIPGFDVREFFVELVSELKQKGL